MSKHLWRPDHPAGHQPFCTTPGGHSAVGSWCSADPREPQTMNGEPSLAWQQDHDDN